MRCTAMRWRVGVWVGQREREGCVNRARAQCTPQSPAWTPSRVCNSCLICSSNGYNQVPPPQPTPLTLSSWSPSRPPWCTKCFALYLLLILISYLNSTSFHFPFLIFSFYCLALNLTSYCTILHMDYQLVSSKHSPRYSSNCLNMSGQHSFCSIGTSTTNLAFYRILLSSISCCSFWRRHFLSLCAPPFVSYSHYKFIETFRRLLELPEEFSNPLEFLNFSFENLMKYSKFWSSDMFRL